MAVREGGPSRRRSRHAGIKPARSRSQRGFSHTFRKFRKISLPNCVCSTSGWNWSPKMGSDRCRIACTEQLGELARPTNPGGRTVTSSLWDSHTSKRSGRPSKSTSGSRTFRRDFPNSGTLAGAASPPKCFAMNWCPAQMPRIGPPNASRSWRSPTGVSFGTIFVSTPRYFRTRHSRWVHCPPLSTTKTRMGYRKDAARKRFPSIRRLLPFDRGRRLVRDVVHDPVDSLDLVGDAGRDSVEHVVGDLRVRRAHAIDRFDRSDRDRVSVDAEVAMDADGLHRHEDGEVLPGQRHEPP